MTTEDRNDLRDRVEGLECDLDSALDVLIARIKGEKPLETAAEWLRLNYPEKARAAGLALD